MPRRASRPLARARRYGRADALDALLRAAAAASARDDGDGARAERAPAGSGADGDDGDAGARAAAASARLRALLDCRDAYGSTPLHWAAERGHAALCRRLLAAGADPHAKTVAECESRRRRPPPPPPRARAVSGG